MTSSWRMGWTKACVQVGLLDRKDSMTIKGHDTSSCRSVSTWWIPMMSSISKYSSLYAIPSIQHVVDDRKFGSPPRGGVLECWPFLSHFLSTSFQNLNERSLSFTIVTSSELSAVGEGGEGVCVSGSTRAIERYARGKDF
jgi:hypothetical protein